MKVSIIVPFYKNYDTIENLLRSIKDQDYTDHETIVVQDGKDDKVNSKELSKKYNVIWVTLEENQGAPAARNKGASLANGSLFFFLDGDCTLYPGMLNECVTQLALNEDIDFVYGNYRYDAEYGTSFPEYDPYLLESFNYICTMSPMRKEVFKSVGGFNEDLTFFQDWDFFYRASKLGYKGKLIPEFIFTTKSPTEDNISGSQGLTLSEKAMKFRKLHNIDKKLVTITHAAPLQTLQRAKILESDYLDPVSDMQGNTFLKYDYNWLATYLVGFFNARPSQISNHLNLLQGKPIIHFIGTDVYDMITSHSIKELEKIKEIFKLKKAKIFANSPRLVEELKSAHIKSELLYTPIYEIDKYKPMDLPKDFTVGVYCSDSQNMNGLDGELTMLPMIFEVAKAMPDIKFKFFGSKLIETTGNIEMCGKIDPEDMPYFINSCSMILRVTRHDGFPQLPIQFLLSGRQALISCPDKELKYAKKTSFEELAITEYDEQNLGYKSWETAKDELVGKIYDMSKEKVDPKELAEKSKKYYSELMSVEKYRRRIYEELEA